MVQRVADLGQPAMGLTDHRTMAGATQLYLECKKRGVLPYPGNEFDLVDPAFDISLGLESPEYKAARRYHLTLVALTENGYKKLVKLTTRSHTRPWFYGKAKITIEDLREAEPGEDIACLSGCLSGTVQSALLAGDERLAKNYLRTYASIFPVTYVELMNHNIPRAVLGEIAGRKTLLTEADLVAKSIDLADELGLPVLISTDAHYLEKPHRESHRALKKLGYGDGDTFSGDLYHIAGEEWVRGHFTDSQWAREQEGLADILSRHAVKLTPLDKFKIQVPTVRNDAKEFLRAVCTEKMRDLGLVERQYTDRLEEELSVISQKEAENYFCLVREYTQWSLDNGICVEARGSANGSLVCYLLGITQIDPLAPVRGSVAPPVKFERFLSVWRKKMADIDLDISDKHHDKLIRYIKSRFEGSQRIGTYSKLGIIAEGERAGRGSIIVKWHSSKKDQLGREARKGGLKGKDVTDYQTARYKKLYSRVETLDDLRRAYPDEYPGVAQLSQFKSALSSVGSHAGGVVLQSEEVPIEDWIPLAFVSGEQVTQFDMDDISLWGLTKGDILGQTALETMRRCQELMGREKPNDFSWIPNDDPAACAALCTGRTTTGLFHFGSWTKAKGAKQFQMQNTLDVIVATALYMPGSTDAGQDRVYLHNRRNPDQIKYLHPVFEKHLAWTYGATVFQDQVLDIMRDLGYNEQSLNDFLTVLKRSGVGSHEKNAEDMRKLHESFAQICIDAGITSPADIETAWNQTAGFAAYGFGYAHAVGYGLRSYRAAYLKTYFPLEYMTALLEGVSGKKDKEIQYIGESRHMGIRILSADVNVSQDGWTIDRASNGIRRGLRSIAGIGPESAKKLVANAPYATIDDLAERSGVTGASTWASRGMYTGALKSLKDAGALDGLVFKQRLR